MASSRERYNNIVASEKTTTVSARDRYNALKQIENANDRLVSAVNFINNNAGISSDANTDGSTDIRDVVRSKNITNQATEHINAINDIRSAYDVLERYSKQRGGSLAGYQENSKNLKELKELLTGAKQYGEENSKLLKDVLSGAYAKRLATEQTVQMLESIDTSSPTVFAKQQQYKQNNPNLYALMGGRAYNPIPSVNPTQLTKEELEKVQTAQAADAKYHDPILRQELKDKMDAAKSMYDDFYKGENDLQSFLNKIGGVGGGEEAREKYKKKYEDAAADYYSLTVGNEEMRKQRISELEREVGILQIKMRENPQNKKSLESQLDEVRAELNGLRTSLYGKVTIGEYVGAHALAGADSVSTGVYNTLGLIIGKPLEWIGWKDNPVLKLKEFTQKNHERLQSEALLASKAMGDDYNVGGMLIQGVVAAMPDAALAFATAGTSKAVQLGTKAPGFFAALSRTATNMAKNPMFWSSYVRTLGNDYDSAIEDGASPEAAFIYAQLTSTLNAAVEIGGETGHGGIQTLPDALKNAGKNKSAILEWVTSSLDEGKEEVIQSVISDLNARIIYNSDKKPDIGELAKEGAMGIAVGGILGGGQISANMILNADTRAEYKRIGEVALRQEDFEGIISYARKSVDTDIRALALSSTPQNISAENAGLLYSYVYKDITAAIASPAESATARQNFIDIMRENDSATVQALAGSRYIIRMSEDPQIGEMPTIDNINTETVIDNGENSELQSTANGGIINRNESEGAENVGEQVYNGSQRIGRESGNSESSLGGVQEANGRVSRDGKINRVIGQGSQDIRNQRNHRDLSPEQEKSLKTTSIKNEDGKPKEVYHFTDNMEFETFGEGDIGFHFGSEAQARQHKENLKKKGKLKGEGRFVKAHLDIKNPVRVSSDIMVWHASQTALRLWADEIITREERLLIEEMQVENGGTYNTPAAKELRRILSNKGYDGIVYQNNDFFEGKGESYIAFYPEQVIIIDDGKSKATSAEAASSFAQNESSGDKGETELTKLNTENTKRRHTNRAEQDYIKKVGKDLGVKVVFEDIEKVLTAQGYKLDGNIPDGYIDEKGVIHIGFNVVNPTKFILKHELTHYGKRYNKDGYIEYIKSVEKTKAFKSWLQEKTGLKTNSLAELKVEYREMIRKNRGKIAPKSSEKLNEEMYSDFSGEIVFNEERFNSLINEVSAKERPAIIQYVLDFFAYLKEKLSGNKDITFEIKRLETAYVKMLRDATINAEAQSDADLARNGVGIDFETNTAFSVGFVLPEDSVDEVAQWVSERTGRSLEDSKEWVKAEQSLATIIYTNAEELDYAADQRYEAIKTNSDYPQGTIDLINLCPKREIYTQMFDALQKIMPNKVFDAVDIANIRQTLSDLGIEVACGLCYVEDRRQLTGEIAQTFSNMWKEAVETGQPLTKTNANGKRVQMHVTKKLATKYGLKQGALIKASGSYIPNQYDLTTYQGFKNLFENEETREIAIAYEAYNNSRGMQAARLIEGRAEYKRQILEWTDDKVKKVNSLGGLRIFSFSDFEAVHLIDMAQVIVDCAARGVKIQGYTKRADFLKLVKNTGIKLNVSHIPKGDTGIKVVNGVKVLDYDFVEGINQKDQNYSYDPNNNDIGNVIVGINDEQIRIAMIDDFIDYIIPFHTNKAKNINDKLGTGKWWNYKNYQVDKNQKTGRKRNINIYTEVLDIYRPKNKTEFVNAFLKVCQNKNMIPRYEQFLNREYTKNGAYIDEKGRYNYVYTEGYHKFLVDFKLFDKSGNIALQREIVPSLDKEYMKSLLEKEVERRKKYEFDQETFEKVKAQFEQAPSLEELKTDGLKKSKNKYDLDFSAPMLEDGVVEEEGDSERDIIEATERISEDYNNGKISREEYRAGLAKLYEEAVKTYGQFPQGEKAVEDIAVPKKVSKSKPVMRFIRTLVESGAFTEDMLEDMSAETLLGNFSYTAVSDESAQEKAEKVLASGKADTEWEEAVIRGQIGKDDIALGEMLLMDAINRNDRFEVLKLSSELADMFTRAGRIVQAARMFKKMTGVGKVVYVNRMVDTLNKSLKEKYGDKFGEGKAIQPIKVDPRLLEELGQEDHMDDSDLYEKNPESVITDIKRNIAEQIPSTWLDKLNAWRYFAMLSNLRTHVRNLIGNVIFAPAVGLKNVVGTVAERTLIRDTSQRTKAVFIAKEYRDFAQKDIKTQETKMMLKGEGQLDEKTQIQQMRRTFETEWLEKLVKGNSNLLEAEDMIFKSIHYKSALASYLQAKKVDLKNIDQKILDQAREYAVNEAKKATFQDASLVADMINKMFKIPKGSRWEKYDGAKTISTIGQFAVEGILPFKRTPINIVKRGVEYSPIGLIKTIFWGSYNVYKKKITMSEFCDGLASGITGTGIALVGMLTYSLGWISAGFGDDDEDKFKKLNGEQEYAVQVFGKSYSMDWAAPACIPFFIGVELMQEIDKDRNLTIGKINDAFWNTLEPMLNLSMLSGLQGVIDAVRYEDENKTIASVAGNIATSFGMQLIPSAAGAVGRTIDDTQRTQYVDKNLPIGSFSQGVINDVKSKVPGLSFLQTPSIDAWGRERKRGGVGERVLENFVSPGYYSEIDYDNVEKELEKIYKATGEQVYPTVAGKSFKVGGKNKFLSGKEWEKYAKAKGSMSYNYIKEFMDSKYYDKLNNDERAEVIKDLYSFANAKAKGEVSEYDIFSVSTYKTAAKYDKNNKLIPYYVTSAIETIKRKKEEKE